MEIFIDDIPESGLTVKADGAKEEWFKRILSDVLGDSFEAKDTATLVVTLIRADEDVDIIGDLTISSHPICDRCLKTYKFDRVVHIHSHMTPLYENKRQRKREIEQGMDEELVKDDVDFSFYEGDRVHLDEIIAEQMVLAEPMKHLCREECKGLCQICGKDLNEGPCNCSKERTDPRWAALKNLKVEPKH